jgi:AcrR family transcriptional regulator
MMQPTAPSAPRVRREGASVNLDEPRAARTQIAFTNALFELLRTRDLSEISISDLCRTAGVHRTTFYGHAPDIYAFAAQAFARELDELATVGDEPQGFDDDTPEAIDAVYESAVRQQLTHIRDHRAAYRMMFGSRVDAGFRRDLFRRAMENAKFAIEVWQRHGIATDINTETAACYVAGGTVGVFEGWAFSDSDDVDARAAEIMSASPAWWANLSAAHGEK